MTISYFTAFLSLFMFTAALQAQDTPENPPRLLQKWRQLDQTPILNYQWPGHWPKGTDIDKHRQEIFKDFQVMGFNGIYKRDQDGPYGSDLFKDKGGFGLMIQARFDGNGPRVMGADGNPAPFYFKKERFHPWCKSIFAEENALNFYKDQVELAQKYGPEKLFHVGDTLVLSSWDETGIYTRRQIEYGYSAKEEYIAFLRDQVFHDAGPGEDTNKDEWTYNRVTLSNLKSWDEVPLPVIEDRYKQPGAWKLWYDFHGYYTALFFQRGSRYMSEKLNQPVVLFNFPHAMVKWPSAANAGGVDLYWEARLGRVLTVEDCQWDHPGTTIHYAIINQLSRRYQLPVMGWSWFGPDANRANDPREIERGLARQMGNDSHGLIMWLYSDIPYGTWREKPEAREALAKWHHIYQAHWDFLRHAAVPAPQVAVLFPRNTGNMYRKYGYPKADYGWACQALSELHVPYEIIMDNQLELEPKVLDDYKVLVVPSATWESPQIRETIARFIDNGGYVMATGDSLLMDTASGNMTDFLFAEFGVRPTNLFKGTFQPSYGSLEEEAWATEHAKKFQNPTWAGDKDKSIFKTSKDIATPVDFSDADLQMLRSALPAVSGTGLEQSLYDPRLPQIIKAETANSWVPENYRTYHDIITAEVGPKATVVATYGTQPVAAETEKTLWVGFRPGVDHAALFPVYQLRTFGEPIWPFEINTARNAAERAAPTRWFDRIIEKSGIDRPMIVTHEGEAAPEIELLTRAASNGDRLIFLINHDLEIGGRYTLSGSVLKKLKAVGDVRAGKKLALSDDGAIHIQIAPGTVALLAAGSESFVNSRLEAQKRVPTNIPPMPVFSTAQSN